MDNRQLFGTDKHVNQLYLSSGRIYKMGEHRPNDASSVETGKLEKSFFCSFNFRFISHFFFVFDSIIRRIWLRNNSIWKLAKKNRFHCVIKLIEHDEWIIRHAFKHIIHVRDLPLYTQFQSSQFLSIKFCDEHSHFVQLKTYFMIYFAIFSLFT